MDFETEPDLRNVFFLFPFDLCLLDHGYDDHTGVLRIHDVIYNIKPKDFILVRVAGSKSCQNTQLSQRPELHVSRAIASYGDSTEHDSSCYQL